MDLDPQAHATSALGIKVEAASKSSYAVFEAFLKSRTAAYLPLLMQRRFQNLWVIGSCLSLSTMEQRLSGMKDAVMVLSNTLKGEGQPEFDYVIIDTPPNLGFLTLNAMHAANRIMVTIDASIFSLNGVSQIEEMLELSKSMGFERPQVNFLITIFDKRSNFSKSFLEKAKVRFSDRLMQTVIRSNVKLREAAQSGKVIFKHDPSSNGAKDYLDLAREVAPEDKEEFFHLQEVLPEIQPTHTFFKLYAPEARSVYLVGSFNKWSADDASIMKKVDNGTWIKFISLPEGEYYYKFIVDGKWIEDPANSLTERDGLGGRNSKVLVKTSS